MIDVIIWSDPVERKAVVWCEDQGDLAFLKPSAESLEDSASLAAGDIIEFDVKLEDGFRLVTNHALVDCYQTRDLAAEIKRAGRVAVSSAIKPVLVDCRGVAC